MTSEVELTIHQCECDICEDRFDEINVGDEAEILRTITSDDVDVFVKLTGDNNPLHVDNAYASKTMLQGKIVHGMLTASFISTLIGTKLPGKGALWYEQHTRFIKPVYIGDKIRVWGKVKKKTPALRVLVLEVVVFGDDNRRVVECEAKVVSVRTENEEKESK